MTAGGSTHEEEIDMDPATQLEIIVPTLGGLVAEVRPEQMSLSTPCARWSTRDLLNHLVGGATMFTAALGGDPVHDISGRLPDAIGDDPAAAFNEAVARFGAAAHQPGAMERPLPLPVGTIAGEAFLRYVAFDLLMHSWDLATTIGRSLDPPPELLADVASFARQVLTPATRDGVNFAEPVAPPEDAGALERLVAFSGRRPAAKSTPSR